MLFIFFTSLRYFQIKSTKYKAVLPVTLKGDLICFFIISLTHQPEKLVFRMIIQLKIG